MQHSSLPAAEAMSKAGRSIRMKAKEYMGGDVEATVKLVKELAETPDLLEQWAKRHDPEFSFSAIPPTLREGAINAIAVAYIADKRRVGRVA